jgi:hypothetical protein
LSPEGDRILYSTTEGEKYGGEIGRRRLWSVGVDGSDTLLVVAGTVEGDWLVPSVASGATRVDPPVEP